jgi:hypothetical protein
LVDDELRLSRQSDSVSVLANEAASSPRNTAATAAASAARASCASSAAAYAAASAASAAPAGPGAASGGAASGGAASAASLGILLAGHTNFFVEDKEGPQANVRHFLFTESELRWSILQLCIRRRSNGSCCRCTGHRHGHADDSRNRYGLLQVLLLCLWHSGNLHVSEKWKLFARSTIHHTPCTDTLQDHRFAHRPDIPIARARDASEVAPGKAVHKRVSAQSVRDVVKPRPSKTSVELLGVHRCLCGKLASCLQLRWQFSIPSRSSGARPKRIA